MNELLPFPTFRIRFEATSNRENAERIQSKFQDSKIIEVPVFENREESDRWIESQDLRGRFESKVFSDVAHSWVNTGINLQRERIQMVFVVVLN